MKVITNNYKPEFPKQAICFRCKSVLEYEQEDIKTETQKCYDQREGDYNVTVKYLDCPCCKNKIEL